MNQNNLNTLLGTLSEIQKVVPPEYLFTKIESRIENETSNNFSSKHSALILTSFCIIFILNVFFISQHYSSNRNKLNLAQTFKLIPNNNLYNEQN